MGPTGFVTSIVLLAASAVIARRFKRLWVSSANRQYRFTPEPLADGPLVSVVIPARNEEANLPALLESVIAQSYRALEIIVVDDGSSDATGEIAARFAERDDRVRVTAAGPLPAGWVGKNHACHVGAGLARGEYLLMVDCDVRLEHAGCVGGMVTFARREDVDLYSVIPRQQLGAFWEKFMGPAVYSIMGLAFLPLERVNDPGDPKAAAVGQCMFFKRESYDKLGGHAAVKGRILEDVDLARLFKSAGMRLALHYGAGEVAVRMYTSLGGLWEGWSKNLYTAAARNIAGYLRILASFTLAYLAPPVVLAWAALSLAWPGATAWGAAALAAAAASMGYGHWLRAKKYRAMRWSVRFAPGFEAAVILALVLLTVSGLRRRRVGGLAWKGRSYSAGELESPRAQAETDD